MWSSRMKWSGSEMEDDRVRVSGSANAFAGRTDRQGTRRGRVVTDEFERAIERGSRRVEMERRMSERLRRELAWMQGEI